MAFEDLCDYFRTIEACRVRPGWAEVRVRGTLPPLGTAATGGHDALIRLLLEHYAYIDAESPNQTTPLMMAAMYGSATTVSILLDAGADPRLRNAKGLSALDFAREADREDSYKLIAQSLRAIGSN
jgi:ankyrin repeat protein